MTQTIFNPATFGATSTTNRVFMAPLTRNRAHADGTPHELAALYYSQRASAGLIISEATQISPMAKGYKDTPGIYNDDHVAGWKVITDAVHAKGGKIFLQLWHVGRVSHTSLLPDNAAPLAPSAIQAEAQTFTDNGMTDVSAPKAMSAEDIAQTIKDYKHAAQCAKDAGFDGVEIHAANGYLINQFLDDSTNQRDDEYGGSPQNRARFLDEVLAAVTSVWDADKVGVRLSPTGTFNDMGDSDPEATFGAAIDVINPYNIAYLHMVEKFPGMSQSDGEDTIVRRLKNKFNGFYIANGDYHHDDAIKAVEDGYADAIAFGRAFIANPDLPERLERDADLNEPDDTTFYGGGAEGYTDYPFIDKSEAA